MNFSKRNYPLLLASQFLGAFGDNFLLAAILAPLTFQLNAKIITEKDVNSANALYSAVFFIAFIVLAPLAGFLNDRMPKTHWLTGGNLLKLLGTLVGFVGVWLIPGDPVANRPWQVLGYFIVGIGACVYSPAKYGILPEILPAERLVKANGTVEMLTLVAIIGGLGGGAILYDRGGHSLPLCYAASLGLYAAALGFNWFMTRTPCNASATFRHSLGEFTASLTSLIRHPRLGRILLGCGLFWFTGATLRNNLQGWGLEVFKAAGVAEAKINNENLVLLKVGLILGIVAGSVLAGQLHKVGDLTWTRRYGFFMAASILLLGLLGGTWGLTLIVVVLVVAGIFAGLLIVPLNAALQHESDPTKLGKTISIQNFVDYLSMLVGAAFLALLSAFEFKPTQVFIALPVVLGLIALALRMPSNRPTPAKS